MFFQLILAIIFSILRPTGGMCSLESELTQEKIHMNSYLSESSLGQPTTMKVGQNPSHLKKKDTNKPETFQLNDPFRAQNLGAPPEPILYNLFEDREPDLTLRLGPSDRFAVQVAPCDPIQGGEKDFQGHEEYQPTGFKTEINHIPYTGTNQVNHFNRLGSQNHDDSQFGLEEPRIYYGKSSELGQRSSDEIGPFLVPLQIPTHSNFKTKIPLINMLQKGEGIHTSVPAHEKLGDIASNEGLQTGSTSKTFHDSLLKGKKHSRNEVVAESTSPIRYDSIRSQKREKKVEDRRKLGIQKEKKAYQDTDSVFLGKETSSSHFTEDSSNDLNDAIPEHFESLGQPPTSTRRAKRIHNKQGHFLAWVYGTCNEGYHTVWICNKNILKFGAEKEKIIISYHLLMLTAPHASNALRIAKNYIEFKKQVIQKARFCETQTDEQENQISLKSDERRNEIQKIDWLIRTVITPRKNIAECFLMEENAKNPKKPLSYLQSVGHVKMDLQPDLKIQMDSWFLKLRDKMCSTVDVKINGISEGEKISKIQSALAKAHGQMVQGIIGTLVMMNLERRNSCGEEELLKNCWAWIIGHMNAWQSLTSVEIQNLFNKKSKKAYRSPTAMDPKLLLQYIFRLDSGTPISPGCIWDLVQKCLQSPIVQGFDVPSYQQFANKLITIHDNMETDQISGLPHHLVSLYLFESKLNHRTKIKWGSRQKMDTLGSHIT